MENGDATSEEIVRAYLARMAAFDAPSIETALNAVIIRNPAAIDEAVASDVRRPAGRLLGPLDGKVRDVMVDLARSQTTTIIVNPEMGFAREVADRIVVMDGGRIIEQGRPK